MPNPVEQIGLWAVQMVETIIQSPGAKAVIALALGVYLVWTLVLRLREGEDPSLRYQSESAAGSTSILLSGVHVSIAVAALIAFITWPAALAQPTLGMLLAGAVLIHFVLEKKEAMN